MSPDFLIPPVKKYVLDNGLTVLHQPNPTSRAFCIGVWTRTGSRDERPREEGLYHFLEHMLFRGTPNRSSFDISSDIEKTGGSMNAFVTKETMCIHAQVLEDHRSVAFELIGDMLNHPLFSEEHISLEKQIVLQEIDDVMDAPDDLVHDLFASVIFPDHPFGRPVLGLPESVSDFERRDLLRIKRRLFKGPNVIVAVYGNVSTRELLATCRRLFDFPDGSVRRNLPRLRPIAPERRLIRRKLHQQHVCIGGRVFSYREDRRFPLMILSTLVGGGASSRLFQRIRERMGLAYDIYTYLDLAFDTGLMATYMAVHPRNAARAIEAVVDEFNEIEAGKITQTELDDTKEQIKGSIVLGLETSVARMKRMAHNELNYGRQINEKELIGRIDAVSLDEVRDVVSKTMVTNELSLISLGPSSAGVNPTHRPKSATQRVIER